jgi:hypothetical protein
MNDTEIAEVLERAADALFVYGHAKLALCDEESGAMCARGAILYAITGSPLMADEVGGWKQVDAALGRYLGCHVVLWNNTPERTEAEVIDAFRLCAKDLRNKARA